MPIENFTPTPAPTSLSTALLKANNLSDVASVPSSRTSLGATTVGSNIFTATNPSAITFPKIAADNTVSFRTPAQVLSDIGAGTGTVTSVGLSTDASWMTVSASPVIGSGTIVLNKATGLTNNQVLATSSGSVGLRALAAADFGAAVIPDSALSSNVPLKNAANTFTGSEIINTASQFGMTVNTSSATNRGGFLVTQSAGVSTGYWIKTNSFGIEVDTANFLYLVAGGVQILGGNGGSTTFFSPTGIRTVIGTFSDDSTNKLQVAGNSKFTGTIIATDNVSVSTAGKGLLVKEGSNAKQGISTLVGGTVVVSNTSVTANSRIFLTPQTQGGTPGWVGISARTAATSFTILSSSALDTSDVAWEIFEPAA